ncbi:MAG: antitoxin family protein [Phycisphaerales bacterium]|nr:antitoxin family protein [Phycisphaerales bacterium]
MTLGGELAVVVEGGLLRPQTKLNFPEHTRLVVAIRRVETTPETETAARKLFADIRQSGMVRLNGWRPSRDEMHERG